MESFFHRLHERRESLKRDELSKRHQWRDDERRVRNASCDFTVKYLGCTEVNDSKGIHIIENAIRTLKFGDTEPSPQFSLFKSKSKPLESLYHFGSLHVSGDGLRFVDDSTEDVLVESPIEKISFCGPVENGKYFGYICREEVHWKWICHTFKSTEDHADRINNAVGCAFRICLEKKHNARMGKQSTASSTAPPPQDSVGNVVGLIGTNATPTRITVPSEFSPTVTPAPSHASQGPQAQAPHVDHFDLAWHSKAPKDART